MKRKTFYLSCITAFALFVALPLERVKAQEKQPYKPMALEGAHWWVGYTDSNMPPWAPYDIYQYVIRGDSVLNDISFKKVYYRDLTDQGPDLIKYEIFAGLMRDDTLNQKVYLVDFDFYYLYDCPKNEEFLLYDFNVNVGDTLNLCLFQIFGPRIIEIIEYEYIYDKERKIFNYGFDGIEGIGSGFGVFEYGLGSKEQNLQDRGFGWSLFDYCLGTDQECGCQWVGIEEMKEMTKLRVYPNPLIGNVIKLLPQVSMNFPLDVKLYDINGREVFQEHFEGLSEEVSIQIPDFLSYSNSPLLLWVGNNQQVYYKQLIIKQ